MYLHFTGYPLVECEVPARRFPYILSTECSFFYHMLNRYFTTRIKPLNHTNYVSSFVLMGYSDYYSQIPSTINYLFFDNLRNSKYFEGLVNNICFINSGT